MMSRREGPRSGLLLSKAGGCSALRDGPLEPSATSWRYTVPSLLMWRARAGGSPGCAVAHGFLALRRALFPLSRTRWTLPQVRRRLRHLLLCRIGYCPLCMRTISARAPPLGLPRI
jgi:hypothetical protein